MGRRVIGTFRWDERIARRKRIAAEWNDLMEHLDNVKMVVDADRRNAKSNYSLALEVFVCTREWYFSGDGYDRNDCAWFFHTCRWGYPRGDDWEPDLDGPWDDDEFMLGERRGLTIIP